MQTKIPAYLHPNTARALLAESRERNLRRRVAREAAALRTQGWSESACGELAEIETQLRLARGAA